MQDDIIEAYANSLKFLRKKTHRTFFFKWKMACISLKSENKLLRSIPLEMRRRSVGTPLNGKVESVGFEWL